MKKLWILLAAVLALCLALTACRTATTPDNGTSAGDTATAEPPTDGGSQGGDQPPVGKTRVDLILFAGDVNMSGRGTAAEATPVAEGHAYEFRAVSDPTKLYALDGSFGAAEQKSGGLSDSAKRASQGSLVPAFCEAYYQRTGTPVVAVSASEGGATIANWLPSNGKVEDAIARMEAAKAYIDASGTYEVGHILLVWCQGESDAAAGTDRSTYVTRSTTVLRALMRRGVETCMVIQSGDVPGVDDEVNASLHEAQKELCGKDKAFVLISVLFGQESERMEGGAYTQTAYNEVGADAGTNAGIYLENPATYKEPEPPKEPVEAVEEDQFGGNPIDLPRDEWNH